MENKELDEFIINYIKTPHEETKEIWKDMTDEQREWFNYLVLLFKVMRRELNDIKKDKEQS